MRPYTRPLRDSSRVRHFAAGIGAALLILALTAATKVGIDPMRDSQGIMDLTIDVQDVPCDAPYDEDERVLVEPDTLDGQIRMHVIVRNRDCCCCGSDGSYREIQSSAAPSRPDADKPEVASAVTTPPVPEQPPVVAPPMPTSALTPIPSRPGALPAVGSPVGANPVFASTSRAGIPLWIGLAAAPALFFFGRDSGRRCDDDETGARSGPSRTC